MPRPSHKLTRIDEPKDHRTIWSTRYISFPATDDFICANCPTILATMPPRENPNIYIKCWKCAVLNDPSVV
jgi:hypothetical protein